MDKDSKRERDFPSDIEEKRKGKDGASDGSDAFDEAFPLKARLGPAEDHRENEPETEKTPSLQTELYDWAQALVTAIVCIVLIFVFAVRVISVDGYSMLPTLHDKDKILVFSSLIYEPEPGDIVVLRKQSFMEQPLVKRVIATGNQTVDINFTTGEVSVDGVVLDEPYIAELTRTMYDVSFPVTVPEGCVFVMGDNRNASSDSRLSAVGMVDSRYVLGRVFFILFPINRIGAV